MNYYFHHTTTIITVSTATTMAADFAEEKAVSIMAAARWSLTKDTIET
jgi:hypothetical protein